MKTYNVNITEFLHSTIEDLQADDCELARKRTDFLDSLLSMVVSDNFHFDCDGDTKLKLINTLFDMKMEYQSFIPGWSPQLKI